MMTRRWGLLLVALAVVWGSDGHAEDAPCDVPPDLQAVTYPADHVEAKLKAKSPLRILVVGSSSSTTSSLWASKGLSSAFRAYPRLLEGEMTARQPGLKVTVIDRTAGGLTVPMVAEQLDAEVRQSRPDLVVWEAGTTDAVRKLDVNQFGQVLGDGLRWLQEKGIDVVLVDIQYSPQTDSLYDFQTYLDYLRQVGEAADTNVLHRYDIMRFYTENGRFEPAAATPAEQVRNANFIHGCLAKQLAAMILAAGQPSP